MLSESFEKALSVKTAVWDPVQKIGAVSGIPKAELQAAGPCFAVALGLALS
jgi:Tfp pilus assembly PilM family ATPase